MARVEGIDPRQTSFLMWQILAEGKQTTKDFYEPAVPVGEVSDHAAAPRAQERM
jgi:hypothetical protein